jgi:hypothetical protein
MRKFWRRNLGELKFPLWEVAQDLFRYGGRNGGGTTIDEFNDLGHVGNLVKATQMESEIIG